MLKAKEIFQYGDKVYGRVTLPKKTASDAIDIGTFLRVDAGEVHPLTSTGQAATFIGISGFRSDANSDPVRGLVHTQALVTVDAAAGTYTHGEPLQLDGANERVTAASGANNTLGWVWENTEAGATEVVMMVDTRLLGTYAVTTA